MKKIKNLILIIIMTCVMLTGCGVNKETAIINQYTNEILEENPDLLPEEAKDLAIQRRKEEIEIEDRISRGEKIDGYNGYHSCKPEVKQADWSSGVLQIADMIFYQDYSMSVEDVKKVIENSQYDLTYKEDFFGYYPSIDVFYKDNQVMILNWMSFENKDYPFIDEKDNGNYLRCILLQENTEVPWSKESVYLPGGIHYFYSSFSTIEDYPTYEEQIDQNIPEEKMDLRYRNELPVLYCRDDLLNYIQNHNYSNALTYENGQDGSAYILGEKTIELNTVNNDLSGYERISDSSLFTEKYVISIGYTFEWNIDGTLNRIQIDGPQREWR